jgi:hypothetical protein
MKSIDLFVKFNGKFYFSCGGVASYQLIEIVLLYAEKQHNTFVFVNLVGV